MTEIRISWSDGEVTATLRDTPTAQQLLAALPLTHRVDTWGDEIYFSVAFTAEAEADASTVVEKGSICFWLEGNALALLFGPTPISVAAECRLISAANIVGSIHDNVEALRSVRQNDFITLTNA